MSSTANDGISDNVIIEREKLKCTKCHDLYGMIYKHFFVMFITSM